MYLKGLFRAFLAFAILAVVSYASVGRITAVNGDVSIIRGAKTDKAVSNFQLEEKDVIKSLSGSTAQIIFNDKINLKKILE